MGSDIMGWYCPLCARVNAPSLDHCPCSEEVVNKSVLDNIPVKMDESAKGLFQSKEDKLVTHNKEH